MTREEYNNLLQELLNKDTTDGRILEILDKIRTERDKLVSDNEEKDNRLSKLVEDYTELKNKRVQEFFEHGEEPKTGESTDVADTGAEGKTEDTTEEVAFDVNSLVDPELLN